MIWDEPGASELSEEGSVAAFVPKGAYLYSANISLRVSVSGCFPWESSSSAAANKGESNAIRAEVAANRLNGLKGAASNVHNQAAGAVLGSTNL
jgi:hypothetical protein